MDIKSDLYHYCASYIATKTATIKRQIAEIREAAEGETKSSAGDKYETAREMMQQDIDMNMARMAELLKMSETMERIPHEGMQDTILPGSVVQTDQGNYYIAVSAGTTEIRGERYFLISALSPIGMKLSGLKAGDSFTFNGKNIVVQRVR